MPQRSLGILADHPDVGLQTELQFRIFSKAESGFRLQGYYNTLVTERDSGLSEGAEAKARTEEQPR
jgi:hypothetical protein